MGGRKREGGIVFMYCTICSTSQSVTLAMCSRYLPSETKANSIGGVSKNVLVGV